MHLNVRLASWEMEESGWILRTGDEVSWVLVFEHARFEWSAPKLETHDFDAIAEPLSWEWGEAGLHPTRLTVGPASLYWDAPDVLAGPTLVTGRVHRGDHTGETPEDFPATSGVVRRVWMVNAKPYAGGPNPHPDPDQDVYEQVTESRLLWSRDYPAADGEHVIWTGVLAEVEVED